MQQLVPALGTLLALCIVLDACAMIVGRKDFPATRALFRAAGAIGSACIRAIGGLLSRNKRRSRPSRGRR